MGMNDHELKEGYEGVLPVWKPVGFTSHDVVAKARRLLGVRRIGHTGTLDPAVTGVLPLCVGRATRVVEYIQELPKEYEAELTVGYSTDTEDATGEVVESVEHVQLDREQVLQVLDRFLGVIEQVPPMYSAVKVEGKRLYELARAGVEVERKARKVEIYGLDVLSMNLEDRHPSLRFRVRCSKGTYIRTLCTDIGRALGYPAVMSELVRTSTGGIRREQCLTLEEIAERVSNGSLAACLLPADVAISHLPEVHLPAREAQFALQGRTVRTNPVPGHEAWAEGLCRVYGQPDSEEAERFLGLFCYDPSGKLLKPEKVFA
ncbi:tRNA pseudouridine(55) synthase TruB [Gorillibacterium sp. CAU 1737]|uniref:tRNA pseudouridine(55) synthase TruB n=1 Tax=Gorillibacterium sp. CAU 1737 TaxID=3140362 RepID=UPI0032613B58